VIKSIFLKTFNKVEVFMINIKAFFAVLVAVSVSISQSVNISGKVTDNSGAAISGALVKLEKGGQATTSGADGSFSLTGNATIIPRQIGQSSPYKLSATIHNGLLCINVAEKSAIGITTFDLAGKALSTVRQTMNAGMHSIALPYRGAGIYLYKVKSGNKEFVLKGNSIDGVSQGTAQSVQGTSSNTTLAKQAKTAASINDVIAATKTGYLNYRVVAYNSDTTGIAIKMIASAGTVTDADGNVYQTVKIGNQEWTVENLRVSKYNDGSAIPFDTSTANWSNAATPKYCFYNNTTNSDSIKKYGALYNWYVVNSANPKKIAPAGWHVPTDAEWDTLQNYLIAKGYNWDGTIAANKIAKSLAAKTDWITYSTPGTIGCDLTKNNLSGFSALPGGYRYYDGHFYLQSNYGYWWSATESGASFAWYRYLTFDSDNLGRLNYFKSGGFSVGLVRDN
jgi:uncharacterized protein (TIGR02145 family)